MFTRSRLEPDCEPAPSITAAHIVLLGKRRRRNTTRETSTVQGTEHDCQFENTSSVTLRGYAERIQSRMQNCSDFRAETLGNKKLVQWE